MSREIRKLAPVLPEPPPPPVLDQAKGVYMWDVDGKRYLDGSSGAMVCNIGHANPRVIEAMRRQMEKRRPSATGCISRPRPSEKLATKTAELCPEGLDRCSSSPADRRRWRARSSWPGNTRWRRGGAALEGDLALSQSYHGATLGALALTGYAPLTATRSTR
jgi:4-aminobutyrate aminotransferase-like enzyme